VHIIVYIATIELCKNLPIVGHLVYPYLWIQLTQFLTNRGTQLVMLGVDNSGRNWYTWSGHLWTQLIHVKRTPLDATDTREADTFGRNWYNLLTAGRNSYFPTRRTLSQFTVKFKHGAMTSKKRN